MSAPVVLGITIRADGSAQVSGEINRVREAVTGAGTAAQNTNREFANMARSTQALSGIMGAFGVTLGIIGLAALAKDILATNREMEMLRARLKSVTGSTEEAAASFAFITKIAKETPFEIKGLTQAYLTLQNFGIKPTIQVMDALTNQAAKSGASAENLQGIALALGQAWGRSKLQGQEIMQLINQSVPVYDLLAQVTGKNSAELADMSEKGLLTRDVIGALILKMGEMAAGSNANAMETLNGKISSLSDAWHTFEDTLMQDKSEGFIKSIVSGWTANLDMLSNAMGTTAANQASHLQDVIDFQDNARSYLGMKPVDHTGDNARIAALNKITEATTAASNEVQKFNGAIKEQDDSAKVSAKELAKLTDTNYKLTHSQAEYNQYSLEAQGLKGDDLKKAVALANANDVLSAAQHKSSAIHKAAISDEERATIALTKSFNDAIESLNLHNIGLSKTPRELEEATLKSKHYTDAMVKQAMALYDIGTALEAKKKLNETEKTELQALTDQYNKLTMSAHDYYATTLSAKGIPTADQGPLVAQFDKNAGLEASKKAATDATTTLDAYNKSLDSTNSKTSDLGKISSAVFDGALGGISAMAGAFDTMVNSISATTKALEENAKMQKLNDQETDPAKKAANFSKYAKEEAKLNNDNIKAQLTGASQLAGAAASMFDKKSAAAKAFHAIEVTLSVARLAMDAVEMASTIGKTIANVSAGAAAMFRDMGPLGFVGVAAMLAVMAGLGFAASGGLSSTQAPPKSSPDTGSVLGDTSASSDSVNKTYTLLQDIHASEYIELKGINKGVADLQSAITATFTKVFQTGGLDTSNKGINLSASQINLGIASMIGGILLDLLFSGGYRKVTERGISTPAQQLSNVDQNGFQAQQYNVVKTKTWDLFSDSTRYDTVMTALDSKVTESMTKIFSATGNIMTGFAKSLGGDLQAKVNEYVIPALRINLTDLNSEDAAKKMNGVINTMLDNMAGAVFGDVLGQYQKLGEGMLETAVRIVSQIAVVKDALESSSIKLVDNIIAISDALVNAAGGLKDFQSQFATYFDKFYSDTEKQTKLQTQLNSQLVSVFVSLATSREGYRKQVEAIDITTAAGQAQYTMMLKLASAADTYYTALDAQTKVYTDAISTAKSNLASAYKSESDAITATISKLGSFIASLKNLKDSLALGNLSTGTPLDKYNEARRQLGNAYNTIQGGAGATTASKAAYDAAVGGINTKLTAFLDASKTYNASGSGYTTDYLQVTGMIDGMGLAATAQQTDAEKQLEQLTKSVDGLITINTSVLSVKDALAGVTAAISALQALQADRDKVDAIAKQAAIQSGLDRVAADKAAAAKALDLSTSSAEVVRLVAAYQKTSVATGANSGASLAAAEAVNNFLSSISGRFNETYNHNPAASAQDMWTLTPKFAAGGAHTGGWRIVGEHGPELENTGPSQIFSNSQSKSMLDGGNSQEIVMELRALRAEISKLRSEQRDNTGALIQSNYDANDQAADKVVTGTKDTAKQSAWAANSKAVIA